MFERSFVALVVLLASASMTRAAEMSLESRSARTHLLELYTSQGCSSCPPAEASFSQLKQDARLWRDFVPVAFHVDYWDNLGWRDPFASKVWTQRQRSYAASWNSSTVYTPGFVLNGQEWREGSVPPPSTDAAGILKASVADDGSIEVQFRPATSSARALDVYVATLGIDLTTNVRAGENRGRKLLHDFVVQNLAKTEMPKGGGKARLKDGVRRVAETRQAVAIWVTPAGVNAPLQAVGGWLP